MQHLQPLPRRLIPPNPFHHLPYLNHMRLALAGIENDAPPRIVQDMLQASTSIGPSEDSLQMRHVDPVSRVRAFVGRPSGEGTPVVVFGYFGAEEKMAFADHFPDDVNDFQSAFPWGKFDVGDL